MSCIRDELGYFKAYLEFGGGQRRRLLVWFDLCALERRRGVWDGY